MCESSRVAQRDVFEGFSQLLLHFRLVERQPDCEIREHLGRGDGLRMVKRDVSERLGRAGTHVVELLVVGPSIGERRDERDDGRRVALGDGDEQFRGR